MEKPTLIFDDVPFPVNFLTVRQSWLKFDAPALFGVPSYHVRSSAPAAIIRAFGETFGDTLIKITNENVLYFSRHCSQFRFSVLSARFQISATLPSTKSGA
jgi:hypothetical protein